MVLQDTTTQAPTTKDVVQKAIQGSRAFVEALGVAVYMTDAEGVLTDYNEPAAELWGRRPQIGKESWCGSFALYAADGSPLPHDACPMAITLKENRPVRGVQAILERPDGSRRWFIPYPTPLRDASGALIGAVNVLVDITELKEAEQALRDNDASLAEALAAKDEFMGLVSHELRTPITTILGNAEIIKRRGAALDEEARQDAVGDILHEAQRLERIVDDLLTLARLQDERLDREPLALLRSAAHIVFEYKRISERAIDVRGDAAALAVGDGNLVTHVLRNYLCNAEKYSADDTTIDVTVQLHDDEVLVRVLDRGIGISGADTSRVFEPYFRGENAAAVSGLGIGLAVCRNLMAAIGGRVWASPRDGGGSEFGFALPAYEEESDFA